MCGHVQAGESARAVQPGDVPGCTTSPNAKDGPMLSQTALEVSLAELLLSVLALM